jgi:transcriptional regulator with XRE-family HTH domain
MTARLFAVKLKRLRQARGLTQEKLAKRAGVSRAYLARLEMGRHDPPLSTLERLAGQLKVKVMELIDSPIATRYAVIVRDQTRFGLLCEVKCVKRSSIIVLARRKDGKFGYPHATYHVDGTRHMRSLGARLLEERGLPRLDRPVRRSVNVFTLTIRSKDAEVAKAPCDHLADYSGVVEIPAKELDRGQVLISVDIIGPRGTSPTYPWSETVLERDLENTIPGVRVTIWKPRQENT